jgi:hypothetical protein
MAVLNCASGFSSPCPMRRSSPFGSSAIPRAAVGIAAWLAAARGNVMTDKAAVSDVRRLQAGGFPDYAGRSFWTSEALEALDDEDPKAAA